MKKVNVSRKLKLDKKTVAMLTNYSANILHGGIATDESCVNCPTTLTKSLVQGCNTGTTGRCTPTTSAC